MLMNPLAFLIRCTDLIPKNIFYKCQMILFIIYLFLTFICCPFQCQPAQSNNPWFISSNYYHDALLQNKTNFLAILVRNPGFCLPLPLRCQNIFQPFIGHEVHPTGWNIWSNKQSQIRKMRDTTAELVKSPNWQGQKG